jgi:hypothetical protein
VLGKAQKDSPVRWGRSWGWEKSLDNPHPF